MSCTATHCNTLQHIATHCNTLQYTATYCTILQHIATRCNALQHIATYCNRLQQTATYRNTLHTARHSDILQHTQHSATYCNALQHTAKTVTHCNTLLSGYRAFVKEQWLPYLVAHDNNCDVCVSDTYILRFSRVALENAMRCGAMRRDESWVLQAIAFGLSFVCLDLCVVHPMAFAVFLISISRLNLIGLCWAERGNRDLDYRLRIGIEEMTLQMQQGALQ